MPGEEFMREGLGRAWLNDGGRVVASTRNITVSKESFPKEARLYSPSATNTYWKHLKYPVQVGVILALEALSNNSEDIRIITIPP